MLSSRHRRGSSVLEFVVAAALILGIITSASVTMTTVQRSVARDRARDSVTTLATGILEQAALFDCQLLVEPSTAASEAAAGRNAAEPSACTKMMYDDVTDAVDLATEGDMVFNRSRAGCATGCETTVIVTSRWMPVGSDGYVCRSANSDVGAPVMLERRATLMWTPSGAATPLINEYVSVESVPRSASFTDPARSSVVVPALPGEAVVLRIGGDTGPGILRIALPCDAGAGVAAEAWFPYLDPDVSYTVVRTGVCVPVDGSSDVALGCTPVEISNQYGPLGDLYRADATGVSTWQINPTLLRCRPMSEGVIVSGETTGCPGGSQ